jgi:putative DNA primase/helicase
MSDVRNYFAARALPWPAPASVRFVSSYRWRRTDVILPAMIVAVQSPVGDVIGIEATALTLQCNRKAFAESRDKVGIMAAGAARFAKVETELGLCEGAETAIAAMHILQIPTWASLGVGRIDRIVIPDSVRKLVVLCDNDEPGRLGAEKALAAYARPGRNTRAEWPPAEFNDWNDVLMARRALR